MSSDLPTTGAACIDGLDCFEQSLQVRRKVGYLPENVPLYVDLTVSRFLRFAAGAKGVESKEHLREVQRVIAVCGLEKVAHRIIGHLSKGYKQRVGLAQALLGNPSVLILDEPTIGLDPTQIIEIRRLIQDLREKHTVLLSSHILPEACQICQRVMIINKGQIIATDSPENLTHQLQKSAQIVLEVASRGSELAASLRSLDGVQSVSAGDDGGNRLLVETDRSHELRPVLARLVVEQGMDLLELKVRDLSLEDIFMQLVTEETAEGAQEESES